MTTCPHCKLEDRGGLHSAQFCIERLAEIIERVPIVGGMILPREPVGHDAYRAGLCCDCAADPYSEGRPRCARCHEALQASRPSMAPELTRKQLGQCAREDCSNPAVPGRVLCGACRRARKAAS